ncbi:NAD(P)-dependent alcohol dehydrogenase [Sphingobium sp. HBC34]|uniref:NAD(P)-dependent alcohol dehydrogenase n=1 Tax=Sphingobium cyanobacteriorum TaxID=3063954 RepID=A0ABT8ZQB2_9SPHN|nr:NAD(P)-dependent alcohol dehydrogenase [Sphingobium sp. HBC34]MDO7836376.1 NAD(P)-dependent alcohol dehydrogenase [Sphingobium sp. HBC34]
MMSQAFGYASTHAGAPLAPFHFERRDLRANDVAIRILYCGVCHSDLHQARNDWHNTVYPCVPGHEIVGEVTAVGASVTKVKPGAMVAIGCLVDSCRTCASCEKGLEQYCEAYPTPTYNGRDRQTGEMTYGGYSDNIVTREEFVMIMPDGLDPERAAPLLCAGITTWSPLRHWNAGPGKRVAVAGLGGLGHMAVKLAVALGADVTVVTTSPSKAADARALGAHDVLISTDADAMANARNRFDIVIDTIPVSHDVAPYLGITALDGATIVVGAIDMLPAIHSGSLLMGRKTLAGSIIGGMPETQELLDFCAEKGVLPDCETIAIKDINTAFERMERSDVKYRFVIDMDTLNAA